MEDDAILLNHKFVVKVDGLSLGLRRGPHFRHFWR